MTLAALAETLKLYRDREQLPQTLPTLRLITRSAGDIRLQAEKLLPVFEAALGPAFQVGVEDTLSQIGSGSLPVETLPSSALVLKPLSGNDAELRALAGALRRLPRPVIGRVHQGALWLDLRCLEDDEATLLVHQLDELTLIVATAGHVDHGKTSLVRALTGVETDTLAEEIERGLTINLGYAYLDGGAASADLTNSIGFIDVPGHRRFINTMISGVSGIDLALLVVAADDGPMPQTLEHIDVLDILGVRQLAVVISKIDQVESARVDNVQEQLAALLSERRWSTPLMFPVSSRTGDGVAALKEQLLTLSSGTQRMAADSGFRLSIDRRFNLNGVGLVTTGTASAGEVKRGDRLQLLPLGRELRVRQLRANNREVESAAAGQRVALGLSGKIALDEIQRGDWLVSAGDPGPTNDWMQDCACWPVRPLSSSTWRRSRSIWEPNGWQRGWPLCQEPRAACSEAAPAWCS